MKKSILAIFLSFFLFFIWNNNVFSKEVRQGVKPDGKPQSASKKSSKTIKNTKKSKDRTTIAKQDSQKSKVKRKKSSKTRYIREEAPAGEDDGEFIEYRAQKGDTIEKIAARFNVEKDDILESNNLKEGVRLTPNTIVLIPKTQSEEKQEEFINLTTKNLKPWKSHDEKYMLVKVAKSFMGAPYKYGGNTVRGLDCSAYVKKIYEIFDVQLPRSAREQFHIGTKINKEDLAIGDLVFFRTKRYIKYPTHVGIYIGDGNFIHSSSGHGRIGVKIDSLSSDFYKRTYVGATRIKKSMDDSADATTSKKSEADSGNS
ncbi:MAG TPA: LysM peptidoglycan-binding domain-containing C40 family peptidase [Syntrophorhabdaceae bacterium]|nr:LysM peptidoglycan-binding domain-containing C40 family peptidase [Syntrophorhabdaceae bacterium]HQE79684.1 LysM peptidoglycan-binding domain-containing C40 family peptidase [Syntrophorhabdaceae bacterium]HQH43417.1 LysM peptidoglycan-binding domain-containing C40 family peptidase [Syntrophorhabdaceae bacterium]HRR70747.1 LysM peptidoglycan-binding domain-containing C40 family peptidase [Syntrophorhabdaceae bacterium]HRV21641.1 LysM peptidoglycan-binding domain-containing C40 family peptidas